MGLNNSGLVRRKTGDLGTVRSGVSASGVGTPSFLVILANADSCTCHHSSNICIIPVKYLGGWRRVSREVVGGRSVIYLAYLDPIIRGSRQ